MIHSFTAFRGEILGVAGIAGSGQKELLEAITNLCPIAGDTISCVNEQGKEVVISGKSPEHISKGGIHIAHISLSLRTNWVWDLWHGYDR